VQLAGSVSWQAHYALRPLATHADHERGIAEQGRGMIELYGAVLVGALGACDTALEREVSPELEVELPEVESVVEVWDEAREDRNGLVFSLGALGEAIWIYGTCRDRDAALLPTVATKLLEAAGFAIVEAHERDPYDHEVSTRRLYLWVTRPESDRVASPLRN